MTIGIRVMAVLAIRKTVLYWSIFRHCYNVPYSDPAGAESYLGSVPCCIFLDPCFICLKISKETDALITAYSPVYMSGPPSGGCGPLDIRVIVGLYICQFEWAEPPSTVILASAQV